MTMINTRLNLILAQIRQAEVAYHRKPGSVLLLAVSKTKTAKDIAAAYQAGQRHFGENYSQEALKKQQELGGYDIAWHFIGRYNPIKPKHLRCILTGYTVLIVLRLPNVLASNALLAYRH